MFNNSKIFTKKFFAATLLFTVSAILMIFLTACNSAGLTGNSADKEKAKTDAYMTGLNTVVHDFGNILNDFQADVKSKNIDSMKEKLEASNKLIDEFNKLEAPDNCTVLHKTYGDGFLQLQQALSNYVQVYSDFVNNIFDENVLNQRVADVQKSYSQGIDLLQQADKLALEI